MKIHLRFFAGVREALGTAQEELDLPIEVRTIGDVRHFLAARGGMWAEALGQGRSLRMAYNQVMSEATTALTEGCEVAFFPPVTGG